MALLQAPRLNVDWNCTACTFINQRDASHCQMCTAPRDYVDGIDNSVDDLVDDTCLMDDMGDTDQSEYENNDEILAQAMTMSMEPAPIPNNDIIPCDICGENIKIEVY
eukprot:244448_1